jgi:hypothetical protein
MQMVCQKTAKKYFYLARNYFSFFEKILLAMADNICRIRETKGKQMKLTVAQYRTILNGLMSRKSQLEELLALNSVYITAEDRSSWQAELDGIPSLIDTMAMASVQESIG